jgi:integrase
MSQKPATTEGLTADEQKLVTAAVAAALAQLAHSENGEGKRTRTPRKRDKVPEYLTEGEIEKLFASIPKENVRDRAIFALLYYRGLRASEIGLLQASDFHAATGSILVRRLKGSRGGEYVATPAERRALKAWMKKRGAVPGPLFPSRKHAPIGRIQIFRLMRRYCSVAGIPLEKAHPHALKHSCGTHLSAREPDIVAVQAHLGHAQLANTMKYVQVSSRRRNEAAERLIRDGWGR